MAVLDNPPTTPDDEQTASPDTDVRPEPPAGRQSIRWSAPVEWLGLPLALLVDIAGVLTFAGTGRLAILVIAGVVTTLVGGFWLWRLRSDTQRSHTRNRLFVLNMFMVALGSGLLAAIWVYTWRDTGRAATPPFLAPQVPDSTAPTTAPLPPPPLATAAQRPAADTESGAASTRRPPGQHAPAQHAATQHAPGQPPPVGNRTPPATSQRAPGTPPPPGSTPTGGASSPAAVGFTATIDIQFPGSGSTLTTGQSVSGSVTRLSAGYQVWLFVRPEIGISGTPEGPCQVAGTSWTCPNVQLPGLPGTREYLDVVVVKSGAAINLSTLTTALAHDATQAYKG
jgi:hypothetical protein